MQNAQLQLKQINKGNCLINLRELKKLYSMCLLNKHVDSRGCFEMSTDCVVPKMCENKKNPSPFLHFQHTCRH